MAVILNSTEYMPVTYTHPNNNWSGCHILAAGIYPNINSNSKIIYPEPPNGSHGLNNKYNNIITVMDHTNGSNFKYYPDKFSGDVADIAGNVGTHRCGFLPYNSYKHAVYQVGTNYNPYYIEGQIKSSGVHPTGSPAAIRINTANLTQYSKISTIGYIWCKFNKFTQSGGIMASTSAMRLSNRSNLTSIDIDSSTAIPETSNVTTYSNNSEIVNTFDFNGKNYVLIRCTSTHSGNPEQTFVYTDFERDTGGPAWQFTYLYFLSTCRMNLAAGGSAEFDVDVLRSVFIISIFEDN